MHRPSATRRQPPEVLWDAPAYPTFLRREARERSHLSSLLRRWRSFGEWRLVVSSP